MRADKYLADRFGSRARAADAIKNGQVMKNGRLVQKPSEEIGGEDEIQVQEGDNYASRAAYKLKEAIADLDLEGAVVLDIGASTGGFTDVCLRKGARKVYALDVGHSQLLESIKNDPRVKDMSGTNARDIQKDWFDQPVDFICMDVSFISAKTVLDAVFAQFVPASCALLVKPQFECGPAALNRNGVLKDKKLQQKIFQDMKQWLGQWYGKVQLFDQILPGRSGNQEALLLGTERRIHD